MRLAASRRFGSGEVGGVLPLDAWPSIALFENRMLSGL